ncbi:MAG: tRNA (adenosine(37)-N6)-threonylcarbamoyltransferase complex dimerization subunit type 1 TsaB [Actinobacteria bacterium]|nr:MAG: tRNA (adenosine(37)-N6)-threonylcarbamoyltransferase complex dimerization subunit type 1 TsaB [Actinomycetota bacterium]
MIVLGFDTATHATAVGLRLPDGRALEARDDPDARAHPGHATRLLAMAGELLAEACLRWSALDRIAVGVGPGRFTGLRVGIATARGLAQALSADLAGVNSLDALAAGTVRAEPGPACALAVIDARRGEVFARPYELQFGTDEIAGSARALLEARLLRPEELGGTVELAAAAAGARARCVAVGDGAVRYRTELERAGMLVPPDGSPLHGISGAAVCRLGSLAAPAVALEEVAPLYMREADAERAREPLAAAQGSPA